MNKIIQILKTYRSYLPALTLVVSVLFVMIIPSVTNAQDLYRQLQVGSKGADVSELQTFLAQDSTIYPQGLVTGYFGSLTKSAVANFQSRNGLQAVGRVGPMTLSVINSQIAMGTTMGTAPTIVNNGVNASNNTATVNWVTNNNAKGVVYYSTSPLSLGEHLNSVDVSGNTAMTDMNYRTSQSVVLSNLQPNTTYYYLDYVTDQNGNVSVTWPSTFTTTF